MSEHEPQKMVITFGSQRRVKCPGCKKFIKDLFETDCPRCEIKYRQYDDERFIAFEEV